MTDVISLIEKVLVIVGGISGLGTLVYAIANILIAQRRPTGQVTGAARKVLRTSNLVIATIVFCVLAYVIWKPLPLQLPNTIRLVVEIIGFSILLPNLGLYIWGIRSLGMNFNASSGFGVRLHETHQLIKSGPFAYLRHPMYLGVILACWGGLLLFRTWTMLAFAVMMFGLFIRGRKEEEALALAFGDEWEAYKQSVPGWVPRLKNRARKSAVK